METRDGFGAATVRRGLLVHGRMHNKSGPTGRKGNNMVAATGRSASPTVRGRPRLAAATRCDCVTMPLGVVAPGPGAATRHAAAPEA